MKFALYRLSHKAWFIHRACAVLSSFLIGFNRSMTEARTIKSAVLEEEKNYVHISYDTIPKLFMNLV